jgi:hypothetical protein
MDDGITKYAAPDDEWHNAAIPVIVVRRWNAIHFRIIDEIWVMFWQVLWEGLRACIHYDRIDAVTV